MMDSFQRTREKLINRQHADSSDVTLPVGRLWQGILALPLTGAFDPVRAQIVMGSLLNGIVRYEAEFVIIDITGIPTVDTIVVQRLLKAISAARLMGADCIISGIRPQLAQTMVQLGIELNTASRANLADAFALALRRMGKVVVRQCPMEQAELVLGYDDGHYPNREDGRRADGYN